MINIHIHYRSSTFKDFDINFFYKKMEEKSRKKQNGTTILN